MKHPVTLQEILEAVCEVENVPLGEIVSNLRERQIVRARRIYAGLAREWTECSFPTIAHHLGRRNHSSAIRQYRDWRAFTPKERTAIRRKIKRRLSDDALLPKDVSDYKRERETRITFGQMQSVLLEVAAALESRNRRLIKSLQENIHAAIHGKLPPHDIMRELDEVAA